MNIPKNETHRVRQTQIHLWDSVAESFAGELPKFDKDPFLIFLREFVELTPDTACFDLGCGAGKYALTLAPGVGRVLGTDISPKMISIARDRSLSAGISNTEFLCMDWGGSRYRRFGSAGRL